jgi:hypothetical protein
MSRVATEDGYLICIGSESCPFVSERIENDKVEVFLPELFLAHNQMLFVIHY